jgi:hypothetical protein
MWWCSLLFLVLLELPGKGKISHSPELTAPNVGGVPQSQLFFQPHFSNQAKLAEMSDTFNIGVTFFAFIVRKSITVRIHDNQVDSIPPMRQFQARWAPGGQPRVEFVYDHGSKDRRSRYTRRS